MANKIIRHKNRAKTNTRDSIRAARVKKTAEICMVSKRYVQMVLSCDRSDEEVEAIFFELQERENLLLQEVKKMIPFN